MRLPALVLLLALRQDPGAWIEKLKSDDAREREKATRYLESLGPEALPTLESVRGNDPEVQARIRGITAAIRTRADLAKVFGATRRVTISFKGRPLGDAIRELGKALGEEFDGTAVDLAKTVDLELQNTTLWESLDAFARAAGVRWQFEEKIKLVAGPPSDLPAKCVEQFRISVGEVKRMDYRNPQESGQAVVVTIFARYQSNLKPAGGSLQDTIVIESVTDADGTDQKVDLIPWASSRSYSGRRCAFLNTCLVNGKAGPLTIEGRTHIPFQLKSREISIPLEEGKRQAKLDDVSFEISGFGENAVSTLGTLRIEATESPDLDSRLNEESVELVDAAGKRHRGEFHGGSSSPGSMKREFEFPKGIKDPQRIVFQWTTQFHVAEIPFRFEGVRLP